MTKKGTTGKSKLLLIILFVIYIIEMIWFFYSQIIKPVSSGQRIDVASGELAIILVVGLLSAIIFMMLKKSKKIGGILIGVLISGSILFCVIAPLFDVYIPVFWKIINSFN